MQMIAKLRILYSYLLAKYFHRFTSRAVLESWQEKQIQKQLGFILRKSKFYHQCFGDLDRINWKTFPMMDKKILMDHFDELNTAHIKKSEALSCTLNAERERDFSPTINGITVGLSSGTSGSQGLFLVSNAEQERWVGVILARILKHSIFRRQRIALFLRANSNLYENLNKSRLEFKYFDLMKDVEEHFHPLEAFSPDVIVAPPSTLKLLVNLEISPQKVVSCAEVLEDEDKKIIEDGFSQPVHQIYQAMEGFLGATCEEGTLHLNEDYFAIQKEYLDEHRFVPIITDFSKRTLPLFRYRLNDILVEKHDPCPCGSILQAVNRIEGRHDDTFYFRCNESGHISRVFPDFIRRSVISAANDELLNYRVVQNDFDNLNLYLEVADEAQFTKVSKNIERSLNLYCQTKGVQNPKYHFKKWRQMAGPTKLRRIEQGMSKDLLAQIQKEER
jgi:putative adenylate-forming enzyme